MKYKNRKKFDLYYGWSVHCTYSRILPHVAESLETKGNAERGAPKETREPKLL